MVSTIFGLIVAAIDTAFLGIVGVPLALLWGLLAFVTTTPHPAHPLSPARCCSRCGPELMIIVIVAYSVINFVIQSVIQPKFVGSVNLSLTLTRAPSSGPSGPGVGDRSVPGEAVDVDPNTRWFSGLSVDGSRLAGRSADREPAANGPRRVWSGPLQVRYHAVLDPAWPRHRVPGAGAVQRPQPEGHAFRAGGLGVGQAHHPERVDQPEQPGEQRDEQGDLQGDGSRFGVDADDLVTDRRRFGRPAAG